MEVLVEEGNGVEVGGGVGGDLVEYVWDIIIIAAGVGVGAVAVAHGRKCVCVRVFVYIGAGMDGRTDYS